MHPSLAFQKAKRAQLCQKLEQELDRMLPLLKAWGVQKVILFKLRMTSDMDLLVVMETSKRFLDRLDELYGLLDPKIALDLLVYTPEEFYRLRETSPLVQRAIAEGRVNPKAEGHSWWRQAERDLDDARYAFDGQRYNLTCFLAQQSAEKALKAYLYAQEVELVWGYSVRELCTTSVTFDVAFEELGRQVTPLDQYYIPTRYPNGLPGGVPFEAYNIEDGQRALRLASHVLDAVQERFSINDVTET